MDNAYKSEFINKFVKDSQSGTDYVRTFYLGAETFLQNKGVHLDPTVQGDLTKKLEETSFYFPCFRKWINSDCKTQGWVRDNLNNVFFTKIQDNRPQKKRTETLTLILACHTSSLPHELRMVTKFLREHPDNRAMIIKFSEDEE